MIEINEGEKPINYSELSKQRDNMLKKINIQFNY